MRLLEERPVAPGLSYPADAEALIREARRLRRRRWLIGTAGLLAVGLVLGLALALVRAGTPRAPVRGAAARVPPASSNGTGARETVVPEQPTADAVAPSGTLYVADAKRNQVLERLADGRFVVAVGTGRRGFPTSGSTARRATLEPIDDMLFSSRSGVLYLAERVSTLEPSRSRAEISAVAPDGTVETVVGGGTTCRVASSGTPARQVEFEQIAALTLGPGGNLYFVGNTCGTPSSEPLFELTGSGRVVPVPVPTTLDVVRCSPTAVAFAADGDLYLACFDSKDILVLSGGRVVRSIADTYPYDEYGGLVTAPDGRVVAGDYMKIVALTPTGKRIIVNFGVGGAEARALGTTTFDGRTFTNSIEPNGIAVNKAGDIFVAATSGKGNGDMTAIVEITSGAHLHVLWKSRKA